MEYDKSMVPATFIVMFITEFTTRVLVFVRIVKKVQCTSNINPTFKNIYRILFK